MKVKKLLKKLPHNMEICFYVSSPCDEKVCLSLCTAEMTPAFLLKQEIKSIDFFDYDFILPNGEKCDLSVFKKRINIEIKVDYECACKNHTKKEITDIANRKDKGVNNETT